MAEASGEARKAAAFPTSSVQLKSYCYLVLYSETQKQPLETRERGIQSGKK